MSSMAFNVWHIMVQSLVGQQQLFSTSLLQTKSTDDKLARLVLIGRALMFSQLKSEEIGRSEGNGVRVGRGQDIHGKDHSLV